MNSCRIIEMALSTSNIILIGMPGAGKSTVGVLLAKQIGRAFMDTDLLIQTSAGCCLQEIVDREGYLYLRCLEEQVLLEISTEHTIIATGGSAVYSELAMEHLRKTGCVIFLDVSLQTLNDRVKDYGSRGLAKRPGQGLEELFLERLPLYKKYADITIACDGLDHEQVCTLIAEELVKVLIK